MTCYISDCNITYNNLILEYLNDGDDSFKYGLKILVPFID